jgi:cellulose synthase (UDP-forming)
MSRNEANLRTRSPGDGRESSLLRLLFWTYAVVASIYIVWRFQSTLSLEHPIFGTVFFVAELLCLVSSLAFYGFICSPPRRDVAPRPRDGLSVDVFITTYDESIDLVRSTTVAARNMDYPHRTWICDDGRRREIRDLAEELDVGYITRSDNTHYKAGNLNHALERTRGEFVVVLDADHILARAFLTELLGYFDADPKLALVQIPQVYYNIDSYQHSVSEPRRSLWHEASVFHHQMQPGADARGAAFFVGTGAILRRESLLAIGGFATDSVTEDIHTSIRLHAAKFHTRYVDRPLGYLLAPETPLAYASQRLRWAQGAMQVLRREKLLWKPGLSAWQRLGYLNSLCGYLFAYQHLVFYLAPGVFLYTGVSPISVDPDLGLPIFAAYITFSLALYKVAAAPHARLLLGECYKMLNLGVHIRGSLSLLRPSGLPFRVTPKGEHHGLPLFLIAPAAAILLFNLTAVGAGIVQIMHGTTSVPALVFTTTLAAFFAVAGALAVLHAFERREHAESFVFPVSFESKLYDEDGHEWGIARLRRINHQIAYLCVDAPLAADDWHSLDLTPVGIDRRIRIRSVGQRRTRRFGDREWTIKVALEPLLPSERDAMDRHLIDQALPKLFSRFDEAGIRSVRRPGRTGSTTDGFEYLPVRSEIV